MDFVVLSFRVKVWIATSSTIKKNQIIIFIFNLNLLHKYDRELTLYKIDDGIQDTLTLLHFLGKTKSSMELIFD